MDDCGCVVVSTSTYLTSHSAPIFSLSTVLMSSVPLAYISEDGHLSKPLPALSTPDTMKTTFSVSSSLEAGHLDVSTARSSRIRRLSSGFWSGHHLTNLQRHHTSYIMEAERSMMGWGHSFFTLLSPDTYLRYRTERLTWKLQSLQQLGFTQYPHLIIWYTYTPIQTQHSQCRIRELELAS